MNYRHIYHAGNRADIVKHITLTHLLKRLVEKPAAFCVMDTHAGTGLYNLGSLEAQKTHEAEQGVKAFCTLPEQPLLQAFQTALKKHNPELTFGNAFDARQMQLYPGSVTLIKDSLRGHDRLIAVEKHADDAQSLKRVMTDDARVHVHARDAWEAMSALLPPPEKRLFVFIDPPFEERNEAEQAFAAIKKAYAKCPHGVFVLWYPIKDVVSIGRLQDMFANSVMNKILRADVYYRKDFANEGLNGSGMIIVNAPWQMDETLRDAYALLAPLFDADAPHAKVDWLKN